MAVSAPSMSRASRPTRCGNRCKMPAVMLSTVSPVCIGAEPASPQPTRPLSVSIRTSTLSGAPDFLACHDDGLEHRQTDRDRLDGFDMHADYLDPIATAPAIDFGESRRLLIFALEFLNAGLVNDAPEHSRFPWSRVPMPRRRPSAAPGSRICRVFLSFPAWREP